jgi:cation transport ATPase
MTQSYQVSGMTCTSCEAKVKSSLSTLPGVVEVIVSKQDETATITMNQPIEIASLQHVLDKKYHISPKESYQAPTSVTKTKNALDWSDLKVWQRAGFNTLNCLIGCSIGDFSMLIFLQYFYPNTPMMTQMILAIIAGLITSVALESAILRHKEKMDWKSAFTMAIGMSFISMVAMEVAMNATDFMMTGGKLALSNPGYWLAFIPSALMGFLVPLPYNYYRLKKYNQACH